MTTLLTFIARIATFLYVLAGIGILFALRSFAQARGARRVAVFGLEREEAESRLRQSGSTILLLVLLIGVVYSVRNVVVPNIQEPGPPPTVTPMVFFVTQQATATQTRLLYPTVTATVPVAPDTGINYATADPNGNGCDLQGARITSPTPGQTVSGLVSVEGEANILNYSQHKLELSGPVTEGAWVVVWTSTSPIFPGWLGDWDTSSLAPGDYTLRLVVLRTDGSFPTPCRVQVVVTSPANQSVNPLSP